MSIHFISGKPGGGKTLYAMKLIAEELRLGRRPIVTNVAVKLPELNEYLQGSAADVVGRIYKIDEEQLGEFWLYRGPRAGRYSCERDKNGKEHQRYEVDRDDVGVLYVLDEVHVKFNARDWATTGRGALFYLSQHRKLGDDVVCTSQAIPLVDKQFRLVAQDFTYISNNSKKRIGWFKLPAVFTRATYLKPPTGMDIPMVKGMFKLDVHGLASCYDTAAGVGILGRSGADLGERRKGLPWWSALIFLGILGCGTYGAAVGGVKGLSRLMGVRQGEVVKVQQAEGGVQAQPVEPKMAVVVNQAVPVAAETNVVRLIGLMASGHTFSAALSDGRVLRKEDCLVIGKDFVVGKDNKVYR